MEWLLGGASVGGIVGVVVLGIYMARMAGNNRHDLRELVQSTKDLADARRDNDGYKRAVGDLEDVLKQKEGELERSLRVLDVAREALASARAKLAAAGDPTIVAADLNDSLGRLSKMSSVPGAATTKGDQDVGLVHGSDPGGPRRTGI